MKFFILFKVSIFVLAGHLFLFGVITLFLGLAGKSAEKLIKNLKADSDELDEKYKLFLKQWNQPRFKLPD